MADILTSIQTNNSSVFGSGFNPLKQANPVQTTPSPSTVNTPTPSPVDTPTVSSTTLSNGNKINQVQTNQTNLNGLATKGISTDQSGNATNANGTAARTIVGTSNNPDGTSTTSYSDGTTSTTGGNSVTNTTNTPSTNSTNQVSSTSNNQQNYVSADTSQEDTATQNIINQLIATSDANTATQVQSIQSQYAIREQQQSLLNASQNQSLQNQLLMGGAGQGGSASSMTDTNGTVLAQESYGIQQLANLDAKENSDIAAAKQAGYNNDFQAQSKLLESINATRQSKIDLATKINDNIAGTNQKLAEQTLQSNIDNGVATIYANGVTDPGQILASLKKQGINATAAQVQSTITTMATHNGVEPSTLDAASKEFFYLKNQPGALPASISSLGSTAEQLTAFVQLYNNAIASGKALVTGGGTGLNPVVTSTMNLIGIPQDMPVSNAITTVGLPAIVNGLIQQEGGSPKGVINNPGNIKFAGLPGQIDSGVKATDGGTFASYSSAQTGQNAVGSLVQNAANKGQNLSDFIAAYKGVTNGSQTAAGTTGSQTMNITTPGYTTATVANAGGLTQSAIDLAAMQYLTSGKMPVLRGASAPLTGQQKNAVQARAGELGAGGNIAANKAQLTSLTSSLSQQQKYSDTITRSLNTATDNLNNNLLPFMKENGINDSNTPIINQLENKAKAGLIDPGAIATFQAHINDLRAEYSQVLSKGGARSVETDGAAKSLIPDDLSVEQMQKLSDGITADANNAIKSSTDQLSQIQKQINNIVSPGPVVSSDNHNGVSLPTSSSSKGIPYKGVILPH
jgi:hypothetical protein